MRALLGAVAIALATAPSAASGAPPVTGAPPASAPAEHKDEPPADAPAEHKDEPSPAAPAEHQGEPSASAPAEHQDEPSAAAPAEHQDEPSADALFAQARAAYRAGRFADTADLLRRVIALRPAPSLWWSLGRAEEQAGAYEAAIRAYEVFLATDPADRDRARAQEHLIAVKQAFGKGWLRVAVDAPDAQVQVDDAAPAPAPVERTLSAGSHRVVVTAPARRSMELMPHVESGELTALDVALRVVPEAPEPPAVDLETDAVDLEPWGWATLGVGGALVAGGVTLVVLGDLDAATVDDAAGRPTGLSQQEALDLTAQADAETGAGIGLLVGGGAALTAGIVLLILDAQTDTSVAPLFTPDGALSGVVCGGSF